MIRNRTRDPIDSLPRYEKRLWRYAEQRVRREHDEEQMAALVGLAAAGGGVTSFSEQATTDLALTAPVELIIEGRRVRAGRISRQALAKMRDGLSRVVALPLTRVGRYGPYWVLTFRIATEQLEVLAEHLTLLPDFGGNGGSKQASRGPLAPLGS